MPSKNVAELQVPPQASLREVLERSNATRRGIVLVVDAERRLLGTITDGDIRRAMLAGTSLETPASAILAGKGSKAPITAPASIAHADLVGIVRGTGISQIPLVDPEGRVVRLVGLKDLLDEDEVMLQAVVMAGGKGSRLHPLTEEIPKPMLPLGDRPLMERIIRQLSDAGIRQVNITTHYRAEKITEHFGDGQRFGVGISYFAEEEQLGTAGGLALLPRPETTLLVINGDILTEMDFKAMQAFHREHGAALTLAVRQFEFQVPYGVVEADGALVREVKEKPTHRCFVNAGIYLVEPDAHALVPRGEHFDMTDLIRVLLARGMRVVSFPIWEYWRDIGQHDDYVKAQADIKDGMVSP